MEYRVKPEYWLDQSSDQVRGFLLMADNVTKTWTIESLQKALHDIGVAYTTTQLQLIGADLIGKGVIEEVT